jgi:hypothetical protein
MNSMSAEGEFKEVELTSVGGFSVSAFFVIA